MLCRRLSGGTTEYGKEAFKYVARSSPNEVQKDLTLSESITRGEFKSILKG